MDPSLAVLDCSNTQRQGRCISADNGFGTPFAWDSRTKCAGARIIFMPEGSCWRRCIPPQLSCISAACKAYIPFVARGPSVPQRSPSRYDAARSAAVTIRYIDAAGRKRRLPTADGALQAVLVDQNAAGSGLDAFSDWSGSAVIEARRPSRWWPFKRPDPAGGCAHRAVGWLRGLTSADAATTLTFPSSRAILGVPERV